MDKQFTAAEDEKERRLMGDYYRIIVVYGISLICVVICALKYEHLRRRDTEDAKNIFKMLILVVIGMVVDALYRMYDPTWGDISEDWILELKVGIGSCLLALREIMILIIVYYWNRFVDYAVYRSFDHVKKKYKRIILPAVLVAVAFSVVRLVVSKGYRSFNNVGRILIDWVGVLCYVLQFYYVANVIWIALKSNKERKAPTFLKMSIFVIPLILGYTVNYLYPLIPVDIWLEHGELLSWLNFDTRFVFLMIATILTWRTVEKRYRYMDPVNGFYNKEFLADMNDYMEKSGYPNGIGVYFKAPKSEGRLIPVLNISKPADAEIFSLGEDEYLLMAGHQRESVIRLLIKSVKLGLAQVDENLTVTSDYAIRNEDESAKEFTERLLAKVS